MRFRDISLKNKLWMFSVFFITTICIGIFSVYCVLSNLSSVTKELASVHMPGVRKMTLIDMMHDGLRAVVLEAYVAAKEKPEEELAKIKSEAAEKKQWMLSYIDELNKIDLAPEVKSLVAASIDDVKKYTEYADELVGFALAKDFESYQAKIVGFGKQFELLEDKLGRLGEVIEKSAEESQKNALQSGAEAFRYLGIGAFVTIFLGLGFSVLFIRMINSRLYPLMNIVQAISDGNFEQSSKDDAQDEIGKLSKAVVGLGQNIGGSFEKIKKSLDQAQKATDKANLESQKAARAQEEANKEREKAMQALKSAEEKSRLAEQANEEAQRALADSQAHQREAKRAQELAKQEEAKAFSLAKRQEKETKNLLGKIDSILSVVRSAAAGDFSGQIRVDGEEPIDNLAVHLNSLFLKVNGSLQAIDNAAENLVKTSVEFVGHNEKLLELAVKTNSSSQVALKSSQVLQAESHELNRKATEIKESSFQIQSIAQSSQQSSAAVLTKSQEAEKIISALAQVTKEIRDFTKVIADISSQTNLLALNATVEAARAGEAGRGFAIVANEVKELANQTKKAAEKVDQQIATIVKSVGSVQNSMNEISHITNEMSQKSHEVFSSVNQQSQSTGAMFELIGHSVHSFEEISREISMLQTVAAQSSKSTEVILAKAKTLEGLGKNLQAVVHQFRNNAHSIYQKAA